MNPSEERIALFFDFENLAIGAREDLNGHVFNVKPIADALAERGRVIVRRAYADWNLFEEFRRMLVEHHVEMIEIPQRLGSVRKNAADIKMAVDAIELSFEREYITTFVIATGDSDFTPLVHKLRELNRRVVGIGLKASTSALLPPACDEFLFYESLEGVEPPPRTARPKRGKASEAPVDKPPVEPDADAVNLERLITQTLAGLQRSADGVVLASNLKRALLRKDPTFSEADHGFRAFGEMLRHLQERGVIDLNEGAARGDPEVNFREEGGQEEQAFVLLRRVVEKAKSGSAPLSGLKDAIRKIEPGFSEKAYGYNGFLQFTRAAAARGVVEMVWSDDADDYLVALPG
ncbi:MAG: NYN domain-containing protein [Acidimicrobiia bacterium]